MKRSWSGHGQAIRIERRRDQCEDAQELTVIKSYKTKQVEKPKTKALSAWYCLPENKKRWWALLSACQWSKRLLIWDVGTTAHAETSWTALTVGWTTVASYGWRVSSTRMVCPCWASYFGRTWRRDRWM